MYFRYPVFLFMLLNMVACDFRPDISKVKEIVVIQRFDETMDSVTDENFEEILQSFRQKNSIFFHRYFHDIIGVGVPENKDFKRNLKLFLSNDVVQLAKTEVGKVYHQDFFNSLAEQIITGFKYFRYYFDTLPFPVIYTYYSGFNTALILDSTYIGVGLDMYLGVDYEKYQQLGTPQYIVNNMYPQKMMVDIFKVLGLKYFSHPNGTQNLLSEMIAEGRLYYFTKQLLPDLEEHIYFGFTPQQLQSCKDNEQFMWNYLVEHQLLYSNSIMVIQKFAGEAPFTNEFSREAPGKATCWTGFKIVEKYMKDNPQITLSDLMNNNDFSGILQSSRYSPKK